MFRNSLFKHCVVGVVLILAATAALVSADPQQDDIKAGLQKLSDSGNYTWTTTTANANGGGFGGGTTTGQTQKDGLTYLKMNRRNMDFEIYLQGSKVVVKGQDGTWQTAQEAASADDGNGGPNPMRFLTMMAQNFKTPVTQAQDNVDKLTNVQKTDDGYSADLTEDGAKALLNPFRRPPTTNPDDNANAPQIDITDPKGSVKISIQDGAVTQIEFHLTGSISFNGGDPRNVDRTTTTKFSNVGSTTITVPDDAKAKLAS